MLKRSRKVTVIGLYPTSRSKPVTLKCTVKDSAAFTTIGGKNVVLPLDGKKAYPGPTFVADLDRGAIIDVSPEGERLDIDGLMLALWADNNSAHQINHFDDGLTGLLKMAMPWLVLVILIVVLSMAWGMHKNGGGL